MQHKDVSVLVLAAGKGTRMKSSKAKVLHEVFFAPMAHHVLDAVIGVGLDDIIVITGHQRQAVEDSLKEYSVRFAFQKEQLGTGHAILAAKSFFTGKDKTVVILCGDTPLIRTETLNEMLRTHFEQKTRLTVMTTILDEPTHYGRIITKSDGSIGKIVEEKDASPNEKKIKEINAGIYCASSSFLFEALLGVGTDNKQGEVYLTDIVEIANDNGLVVNKFLCADADEVLGVNSRVELAEAHRLLQQRHNYELMVSGVTMLDPSSIFIEKSVKIGRDTVILPNTHIMGESTIGEKCSIGPNVIIKNCRIGENVRVNPFVMLQNKEVAAHENISVHAKTV